MENIPCSYCRSTFPFLGTPEAGNVFHQELIKKGTGILTVRRKSDRCVLSLVSRSSQQKWKQLPRHDLNAKSIYTWTVMNTEQGLTWWVSGKPFVNTANSWPMRLVLLFIIHNSREKTNLVEKNTLPSLTRQPPPRVSTSAAAARVTTTLSISTAPLLSKQRPSLWVCMSIRPLQTHTYTSAYTQPRADSTGIIRNIWDHLRREHRL